MSSFDRRSLLLGLLGFSACGFEPIYGDNGSAAKLRGAILVDAPDNLNQFRLVEQLERRLGRADQPRYSMQVDLTISQTGIGVTGSNDITRYNIRGAANFKVREMISGNLVLEDSVDGFTAYSASTRPVATLAAERDANARLMVALADKVTAQLILRSDLLK